MIRKVDGETNPDTPLFKKSFVDFGEDVKTLKTNLRLVLESIAKDGKLPNDVNWSQGRRLIEFMIAEQCQAFKQKLGYLQNEEGYESFEENLEVLLMLFDNFKEVPPFTLQRICQLIIEGNKYYNKTHHYMFALEKCLNISMGIDFKDN